MDFKVTEQEKWQRVVEIVATREELEPEFEKALKRYQKNAKLQGFRKGKVPMQVIKKLYGQQIEAQAIEDILPGLLNRARQEKELRLVAPAKLEKLDYRPGSDLKATFRVEVEPEVEVSKFENFKFEKQIYEVSEEDIDSALQRIQQDQAAWETSEEGAAEDDFLLVDLQEVDRTGVPVIGRKYENQFVAVKQENGEISELGRQLLGAKTGDVRRVTLTPDRPEGSDEPIAPVNFQVTVKEVKRRLLPHIDDDLAKDIGEYESLAQLKEVLDTRIHEDMQKQFDESLHHSIIDEIIKSNPMELPESMVSQYLEAVVERVRENAENGDIDERVVRENYRASAIWNLKWRLIRRKLAEMHEIRVSDEDLHEWVNDYADKKGIDAARAWTQLRNDAERLEQLRSDLLEEKVLEFLVSKQKIKEKTISRKDLIKKKLIEA